MAKYQKKIKKNQRKITKTVSAVLLGSTLAVAPITFINDTSAHAQSITQASVQLTDNIKEGLSFLNQKRAELGLSSLVVNQKLMQSALAHAEYISYNQAVGHIEDPTNEKFVGGWVQDRAEYFGYTDETSEVLSSKTSSVKNSVIGLLDAPFHRIHLLDPNAKEVGLAQVMDAKGLNPQVINTGLAKEKVEQTVVYPFNGQQAAPTSWFDNESPSPLAHIPNAPDYVGYPITLNVYNENVMSVYADKVQLTDESGNEVPFYIFDGHQGGTYRMISIFPKTPLDINKTYHVSIDYTLEFMKSEKKEQKSWSFHTVKSQTLTDLAVRGENNGYVLQLYFNTGTQEEMKYEVFKDNKSYQRYNIDGKHETRGNLLTDGDYTAILSTKDNEWNVSFKIDGGKVVHYAIEDEPQKDVTAPGEVSNLKIDQHTKDSVTVSWRNPIDTDFAKANLYLDGKLVGSVNKGQTPAYTFKGLSSNTDYRIIVKTVDESGNESSGASIQVKTDAAPDTTSPSEVSNLHVTDKSTDSLTVSWANPTDKDYAKANLYLDGKLVGNVKASETPTFIFEGLSPNTNYRILVKTVDESGNESLGKTIQEKTEETIVETPTEPSTPPSNGNGNGEDTGKEPSEEIPDLSSYKLEKEIYVDDFSEASIPLSKAVDPKTITPKSVFMVDENGEPVDIKIEVVEGGKKLNIQPMKQLAAGQAYTLYLNKEIIRGTDGETLRNNVKYIIHLNEKEQQPPSEDNKPVEVPGGNNETPTEPTTPPTNENGNGEDTGKEPSEETPDLSSYQLEKEIYVDDFSEASIPFSKAVDPKTITSKSVFMLDENGEPVDIKVGVVEGGKKLNIQPIGQLAAGHAYTLYLNKEIIRGTDGQTLRNNVKYIIHLNEKEQQPPSEDNKPVEVPGGNNETPTEPTTPPTNGNENGGSNGNGDSKPEENEKPTNLPDLTKFDEFTSFSSVQPDTKFTVSFRGPEIDKNSLTKENVFALDSKGNKVEIEFDLVDGHTLIIKSKNNWKQGEVITVYLDDTISAKNGSRLIKPIKFIFKVK